MRIHRIEEDQSASLRDIETSHQSKIEAVEKKIELFSEEAARLIASMEDSVKGELLAVDSAKKERKEGGNLLRERMKTAERLNEKRDWLVAESVSLEAPLAELRQKQSENLEKSGLLAAEWNRVAKRFNALLDEVKAAEAALSTMRVGRGQKTSPYLSFKEWSLSVGYLGSSPEAVWEDSLEDLIQKIGYSPESTRVHNDYYYVTWHCSNGRVTLVYKSHPYGFIHGQRVNFEPHD